MDRSLGSDPGLLGGLVESLPLSGLRRLVAIMVKAEEDKDNRDVPSRSSVVPLMMELPSLGRSLQYSIFMASVMGRRAKNSRHCQGL